MPARIAGGRLLLEHTEKLPRLRQLASAKFDNENSPPNQMMVVVHGLFIVNRDQTKLN